MTGSRYAQGVRVEHAVIADLTANGYACTRAASSKGVADVIALKRGEVLMVNVKRTTMPGPAERAALFQWADVRIFAIVALKPNRKPIEYRKLTGTGPRDWTTWTPDHGLDAS